MKRILLVMALLLMVQGVAALGSPIKDTFQDYTIMSSFPAVQGNWYFETSGINVANSTTYGYVNVYESTSPQYIQNADPMEFTYAAFTASPGTATAYRITLLKDDGTTLYTSTFLTGSALSRFEIVVSSGGVTRIFRNDLQQASTTIAVNPSYLRVGVSNGATATFDDFVVGYESDPVIIGTLPSGWFIKYDATSPASTGLYQMNVSDASMPILRNSNYYGVTYGRSVNTSTTLQVIDPAGNVVDSYPVANMSGQFGLPIENLKSDGAIRNGLWRVSLADDAETSYFWVMGGGAEGTWSQESYTQGDTATFSYTILDSSWNTGTSTYRFDVLDVYGNVVDTQTISTQTGAKTVSLDSTDYPSGVYYGAVIQTTGGEDTWMAADAMEVSAYIKYVGGIYDAESEAQITSNVAVTINQGSIIDTTYTETGVYNSTEGVAFGTGSLTTFTVSATGYQTSITSFTPMIAKTIVKNITLIRSSPTCPVGICLGGLANETVYSRPVANVTIAVTNATYGESYSTSTNSVGWYNLGESDGVFFTNGRCYSVAASKAEYTGNTYLKCVVGS